jgi:transcriptional regulator with XRE-family HTH domain
MSVEQLAEASNASTGLVEQLENGELVPSLTPLLNIARALGVRVGTFLDDTPQDGPVFIPKGEAKNVVRFSGKHNDRRESCLDFYSLAADKRDRHMEPFIIDVFPCEGEHTLSPHEGEEFLYVLSGSIEILYGRDSYLLNEGDSIYYDSVVPHDVHAVGGNARIIAVVYAPF